MGLIAAVIGFAELEARRPIRGISLINFIKIQSMRPTPLIGVDKAADEKKMKFERIERNLHFVSKEFSELRLKEIVLVKEIKLVPV